MPSSARWYPFDHGATLGQAGPEGGTIAPFSITCGVYGLLMHTRFLGSQAEGEREYDAMKVGLVKVAESGGRDFNAEASAFAAQFP